MNNPVLQFRMNAPGVWLSTVLGALLIVSCSETSEHRDSDAVLLSASQMESAVRLSLAEDQILVRASSLVPLMQSLNDENVAGAARVFEENLSTTDNEDLRLFLAGWAAFDPRSALDHASGWEMANHRKYGVGVISSEWAARGGGLEAVQYLRDVEEWRVRDSAFGELIYGWVRSGDISGATEFVANLPQSDGRNLLIENLVKGVMLKGGIEGTIEWAVGETEEEKEGADSQFRKTLLRKAVRHVAHRDPLRAAKWYQQLPDEHWVHLTLNAVVTEWAERDPQAALDWTHQRPDSQKRDLAIIKIGTRWARDDLYGLQDWLEASDTLDESQKLILGPFVRRAALSDPEMASIWVEQIEDHADRDRTIVSIARSWRKRNANRASEWLESLDLAPEVMAQAVHLQAGLPQGQVLFTAEDIGEERTD